MRPANLFRCAKSRVQKSSWQRSGGHGGTHYHRTPGYPPAYLSIIGYVPLPHAVPRTPQSFDRAGASDLFLNTVGYADFSDSLSCYVQLHILQPHTCDMNAVRIYILSPDLKVLNVSSCMPGSIEQPSMDLYREQLPTITRQPFAPFDVQRDEACLSGARLQL